MAHPGGRPTLYNEKILETTIAFYKRYFFAQPTIEKKTKDKEGKETSIFLPNPYYYKPPYKEQLALELDIDGDTIVEWCGIHSEFSAAIKKIETLCKLRLFDSSMEKSSATGSIFLLKVNHGMVETEKRLLGNADGSNIEILHIYKPEKNK